MLKFEVAYLPLALVMSGTVAVQVRSAGGLLPQAWNTLGGTNLVAYIPFLFFVTLFPFVHSVMYISVVVNTRERHLIQSSLSLTALCTSFTCLISTYHKYYSTHRWLMFVHTHRWVWLIAWTCHLLWVCINYCLFIQTPLISNPTPVHSFRNPHTMTKSQGTWEQLAIDTEQGPNTAPMPPLRQSSHARKPTQRLLESVGIHTPLQDTPASGLVPSRGRNNHKQKVASNNSVPTNQLSPTSAAVPPGTASATDP